MKTKRKLQVFVSSTFKDLIHERQAAVSAILKAGHIPAGMELFTSGDRSQMQTIEQWIDESDVYMLILGGRYGSIEPTSKMSYTELEYDYAVQLGKPFFSVAITEKALEIKVKEGSLEFIERESQKELALFRQKVLGNISSFFDDSKDIKLCVHETLADFAANRELKGWVSAEEIVDTKPLFEEIRKLAEENNHLRESLREEQKRAAITLSKSNNKFKDIQEVLRAIQITISADVAGASEDKLLDLYSIFYSVKDTLVNGVTNSSRAGKSEIFLYYQVCPKLQVHGLMVNEKVAGAQFRRYAITKEGSAFLAEADRNIVLKEKIPALVDVSGEKPVTTATKVVAAKSATSKTKSAQKKSSLG